MSSVQWLTRTAILLAITIVMQMLGLPQGFTGPAVNAMLLLAGIFVNPLSGISIGLLTPLIALLRGILPPPLAPAVPFIMLGNALFVLVASLGIRKNMLLKLAGIIGGAVGKFLILSLAVQTLISVPPAVAKALQAPQLFTALTGGISALVLAEILFRLNIINTSVDKAQ